LLAWGRTAAGRGGAGDFPASGVEVAPQFRVRRGSPPNSRADQSASAACGFAGL